MNEIEIHSSEKKKPVKAQATNNSKPLAKGQTTLTGMFGVSVNKWLKLSSFYIYFENLDKILFIAL